MHFVAGWYDLREMNNRKANYERFTYGRRLPAVGSPMQMQMLADMLAATEQKKASSPEGHGYALKLIDNDANGAKTLSTNCRRADAQTLSLNDWIKFGPTFDNVFNSAPKFKPKKKNGREQDVSMLSSQLPKSTIEQRKRQDRNVYRHGNRKRSKSRSSQEDQKLMRAFMELFSHTATQQGEISHCTQVHQRPLVAETSPSREKKSGSRSSLAERFFKRRKSRRKGARSEQQLPSDKPAFDNHDKLLALASEFDALEDRHFEHLMEKGAMLEQAKEPADLKLLMDIDFEDAMELAAMLSSKLANVPSDHNMPRNSFAAKVRQMKAEGNAKQSPGLLHATDTEKLAFPEKVREENHAGPSKPQMEKDSSDVKLTASQSDSATSSAGKKVEELGATVIESESSSASDKATLLKDVKTVNRRKRGLITRNGSISKMLLVEESEVEPVVIPNSHERIQQRGVIKHDEFDVYEDDE